MQLLFNNISNIWEKCRCFRLKAARREGLSISGRCIAILLVMLLLILGPASYRADIVAAALAWGSIALIALTAAFVAIYGRILRRKLSFALAYDQITLTDPSTDSRITSGEPVIISLKSSGFSIPPFFRLGLKLKFEHRLPVVQHVLLGRHPAGLNLNEKISFPHRGDWQLTSLDLTFSDYTGLVKYGWKSTLQSLPLYRVHPPPVISDNWPIISSAQRSGDAEVDLHNRQGDPYDLKRYHPSDGIKKIVWKVYAKSGELIARHPEASMTPEGQILIYALLREQDDHLCGQLFEYCKRLEDNKLQLYLGCLGMGTEDIASSLQDIEELLITSAWKSAKISSSDIISELRHVLQQQQELAPQSAIERVVLPLSYQSVESGLINLDLDQLSTLTASLNIKPVFFIIKDLAASAKGHHGSEKAPKMANLLKRWFTVPTEQDTLRPAVIGSNFLATIQDYSWDVFLIESLSVK